MYTGLSAPQRPVWLEAPMHKHSQAPPVVHAMAGCRHSWGCGCQATHSMQPSEACLGAAARTQQVGVEEGAQDVIAAGEGPEDLAAGEGRVQEEPDARAVEALAQQARQHLERKEGVTHAAVGLCGLAGTHGA